MKAFEKEKILHRDISVGNVMIGPNGRGVLNDWDHAGRVDAQDASTRQFDKKD